MKRTRIKATAVFLGLLIALAACGKTDSQKGSAEAKKSRTLSVSSSASFSENAEKESLSASASSLSGGAEEVTKAKEELPEEAKASFSETQTEKRTGKAPVNSAASMQTKPSGSKLASTSAAPQGSAAQASSPSSLPKASSGSTAEKPHQHTWKAVYQTVEVPEKGHMEKKLVRESWTEEVPKYDMVCHVIMNGTNEDVTHMTNEEIGSYAIDLALAGKAPGSWRDEYRYEQVGTTSVVHDAEYEDVYVVDSPATTRQEFSHYECTDCGAVR